MELEMLAKDLRCLQLLQSRANESWGYMIGMVKALFILTTIRCIYGAVKMNGIIQLFSVNVAVLGVGFLAMVFRLYGDVWEASRDTLQRRKFVLPERRNAKWFRAFHRSCQPLRFEIAGLYYADPGMSLTLGLFAAQNVANLLILDT